MVLCVRFYFCAGILVYSTFIKNKYNNNYIIREAIFATLEKTRNDLEAQRKVTEYEFRKRIHETLQTKNELEWQQSKVW